MSYSVASALGVAAALTLDLAVLRTQLVRRRVFWASYPIVLVFQLLFNGILTSRGVVRYDPAAILGVRVASAPVEDLAFGFALVLSTLSLWVWWERRDDRRHPDGPSRDGPSRERSSRDGSSRDAPVGGGRVTG